MSYTKLTDRCLAFILILANLIMAATIVSILRVSPYALQNTVQEESAEIKANLDSLSSQLDYTNTEFKKRGDIIFSLETRIVESEKMLQKLQLQNDDKANKSN